jgi:glucan phosphoethanolaminetransferase (alkaline phosphatase superfamily)
LQLFFNTIHNPAPLQFIQDKSANLFKLARHQGYKTFLISAQGEGLFHEVGTQFIDFYSFKNDKLKELKANGEDVLLEMLTQLKFDTKNFIVIHLRHIFQKKKAKSLRIQEHNKPAMNTSMPSLIMIIG